MIESIFFDPWIWITGIIFGILMLVSIIGILAFFFADSEGGIFVGVVALIIAAMVAIVYFGFLLVPYDSSFYQTYKITGEITELETAFDGDEGTFSQIFVAKVDGIDLYIKSDDQRFRSLSVGDEASFVCGKRFEYFQEPWYDCNFAG